MKKFIALAIMVAVLAANIMSLTVKAEERNSAYVTSEEEPHDEHIYAGLKLNAKKKASAAETRSVGNVVLAEEKNGAEVNPASGQNLVAGLKIGKGKVIAGKRPNQDEHKGR